MAQSVLLGSAEQAVAQAKNTDFNLADLPKNPPPAFEVEHTEIKGNIAHITLRFAEGRGADDIEVFVNGSKITGRAVLPPKNRTLLRTIEAPLSPGDNGVKISGSRNGVAALPLSISLNLPSDGSADEEKGDLYLLAVGVNDYPRQFGLTPLQYAAADALALHELLRRQEGRLFKKVNSLVLAAPYGLPTGAAIRDGLRFLQKTQSPRDTAVLFLAGHGVYQDDEYYFLPQDTRLDESGKTLPGSTVPWRDFLTALQATQGRRVLLVDTCRAAGAYNPRLLKDAQVDSIVVFSATDIHGIALELEKFKHGAFTYALLKGLESEADFTGDKQVSTTELPLYLSNKLKMLTEGQQEPAYFFSNETDFPLSSLD